MMTRTTLVCHSPAGSPFHRCVGECPLTSVSPPMRPSQSCPSASTSRRPATSTTSRSAGNRRTRRCGAILPCARPARQSAPAGRDGTGSHVRRRCAGRQSSPTPPCAGCWKSSTAVVPPPSCGHCWHPASSTRCSRSASAHQAWIGSRRGVAPVSASTRRAHDPDTGNRAAEVFGSYSRGDRIHAIACRVEQLPTAITATKTRWLVVALHIG